VRRTGSGRVQHQRPYRCHRANGGRGEVVFGKGIGLGTEIGYVAPTGGYTILFQSGSQNLFNVEEM
jgi:hypothetical protein